VSNTNGSINPLSSLNSINPPFNTGYEPFVAALDFPDQRPDATNATPSPVKNNPAGTLPSVAKLPGVPSYPVFVDPMGYVAPWQSGPFWVANQMIPRRTLSVMIGQSNQYAQRVCSLMDGFGYDADGKPSTSTGPIERELRYNWLWVIQRQDNSNFTTANMTVVVFDKRAFLYAPPTSEQVFFPQNVPGAPAPGTSGATSISFAITSGIELLVQKGGWILDATINPTLGVRNANFYRVVSVTDDGTFMNVELQTPIKPDALPAANQRTFIVLAGVSEVFERPPLTSGGF
jgi:hypothetical protein